MLGTWRRVGMTGVPAGNEGKSSLLAVRDGGLFMADVRTARNPRQHDLFWALCDLVAEARDTNKRAVADWLLKKQGLVDVFFHPDGAMAIEAKSLAYHSMEQAAFDAFFQLAVAHIGELLGNAPADVWKRYEDLLAADVRAETRKRFKRMASPSIAPEQANETEKEKA